MVCFASFVKSLCQRAGIIFICERASVFINTCYIHTLLIYASVSLPLLVVGPIVLRNVGKGVLFLLCDLFDLNRQVM